MNQEIVTCYNIPKDIVNYIINFWPEYDSEIHNWENAAELGRLDLIKLLHKYNISGYSQKS